MACIFMPFVQLSVMDVISAALTPSGPPICIAMLSHVRLFYGCTLWKRAWPL